MSGLDIHAMVSEARGSLPLWIGKTYQYDTGLFGIRLNGKEKQKFSLIIEIGKRMHFTFSLPAATPNPSGYSMFLRKYCIGGRILGISQPGIERVIDIEIGKSDNRFHLIVELFDEGNIILTDGEYTIIQPLRKHRFKDREVTAGAVYTLASHSAPSSVEEVASILHESDADTVRTLATRMLLGGKFAEEVCSMAGVSKSEPAVTAPAAQLFAAYSQVLKKTEEERSPCITSSGCWPFLLGNETADQTFTSFHEALDQYYPRGKELTTPPKPKLTREENIRKRQLDAIASFEKKIERYEAIVETLYTHYTFIDDVLAALRKARSTSSWQEIEKILRTSDSPSAAAIKAIYPAESAIDLDIEGKVVKLFVEDSIEVNANRYYEMAKKFKKKRKGAFAAMERMQIVPKKQKITIPARKKKWYHRFRWCYTSDGVLMVGGKDAGTNEEIVKKYLQGGDTFVHADVHGGSVIIVKGATKKTDEVAQFAASYSNAWKSGHMTADVYAAAPNQVSKTPETGEYVARGSFVIRGERTYFHNVPLGVAIGLQTTPEMGVIGGPIDAVKSRAEHYVILRPGQYEPNDAAKKILRILREKYGEGWKSVKNILNSESVAAFVPPGGSDITEEL
ncbi:ribosome rescue protein RqcH [Methanogenium organophilum]|uniref:Ribosome rescue protein RqcH n=1 Tax=Methanogenium organophilum TaxID=2199 RepID=A0A9X9T7F3_METOG|nr:ribosome rescue protein RqcH [Methanogenium organophilum]WAI01029.1 ribosome rescue protein RqcH [Methanogenium organophilum]